MSSNVECLNYEKKKYEKLDEQQIAFKKHYFWETYVYIAETWCSLCCLIISAFAHTCWYLEKQIFLFDNEISINNYPFILNCLEKQNYVWGKF